MGNITKVTEIYKRRAYHWSHQLLTEQYQTGQILVKSENAAMFRNNIIVCFFANSKYRNTQAIVWLPWLHTYLITQFPLALILRSLLGTEDKHIREIFHFIIQFTILHWKKN
jgi:hypothetical protein